MGGCVGVEGSLPNGSDLLLLLLLPVLNASLPWVVIVGRWCVSKQLPDCCSAFTYDVLGSSPNPACMSIAMQQV